MAGGIATLGMLLAAAGCGDGSSPAGVEVAPVSGIVRYNGAPLADAWVQFSQTGSPIVAGGFTDDAGEFELTSYQEGDGAPVGENIVTISLAARPADDKQASFDAQQAEAMKMAGADEQAEKVREITRGRKQRIQQQQSSLKSPQKLPKRYSSAETSRLSFTVVARTQNDCEFELTD